jgi:hypothetical protein
MYTVTRQRQWPNGTELVEVSCGGIDYTNPDALGAKYAGEFEEFANPIDAVETAIEIARAWRKDSHKRISIGVGSTHGMTMPFDSGTFADARAWAKELYAKLEKCPHCGEIMQGETWHANDWDGLEYCSERCAERVAEWEAIEQAKYDAENGIETEANA